MALGAPCFQPTHPNRHVFDGVVSRRLADEQTESGNRGREVGGEGALR